MNAPIEVRGARVHNLKNISVDIPRDKIVVITGISGSGKSSLVFDTVTAEAHVFFEETEIRRRLGMLLEVGLEYLPLGQRLDSLSGGEAQRIKLAAELWKKGRIYIMDEPTIGLHAADIGKLLRIIERLVASGNTVIVIEHNLDVICRADWVIDIGPGAGKRGGAVVAQGTPETVAACASSHTGRYLKTRMSRRG